MSDWSTLATQKRTQISALIPPQWRLKSTPSAEDQRDVTGEFIRQFLSAREVEITETDAVGILEQTRSGLWRAEEVARAFCHRAGVAHQLVCMFVCFEFCRQGCFSVKIMAERE